MEQETTLNAILAALKLDADHTDKKLEAINTKIDDGFANMNQRFDRLEKKSDGMRVKLTETQETTDFVLSKIAQHEQKICELTAE